ncbi:MAG: replication factor C small subunit [Hyperionvirus sp.]|uniref:Replication factor C small subunit n=1 Tax=Hyperionvirus sp. TaxID=2487770 RepID=A0A3G5ACC6_9VIRU|nr:MAG: replication factor C small subunit [Hyperionvirus sp.]
MSETILCVDGYDDETCSQIDISGTLSTDIKAIKKQIHKQLPWIEKYRPKKLEDIILDSGTLTKIKRIIAEKNMPNIIITGIPGIGKTTTLKCMAHDLYGEHMNNAVLELNASDDRGIKTVEEAITNFCKKSMNINNESQSPTYANHKMIILDEADNITKKAQHSINKKMQEYSATTRFAFTCNKSTDIIEAIQSRCIILRYIRLPMAKIIDKLKYIAAKEKIPYDDPALTEIATISQGDMRSAINTLQLVFNGLKNVTIDNVYKVCDKPQPMILQQILTLCKDKNIPKVFEIIGSLKSRGYSDSDIILGMINVLKFTTSLPEKDKNYIMRKICNTAYIISKGINTDLQLYACMSSIILNFPQSP